MIVHMDLEKVRGFVTEHGGASSHAAVMARSLGIPAVSGVRGLLDQVRCSDVLLVDGDKGEVYLHPDAETIARLAPVAMPQAEEVQVVESPPGIEVMANASLFEDVKAARWLHADGIGLFRTEILFLESGRPLSEEEQYRAYRQIAEHLDGRPVTFRLLDVGGDKPLPFMGIEKEENPYLGWRGARFLLGSPAFVGPQVRALARASRHGNVRIMFPMVVDATQARALCDMVREHVSAAGVPVADVPLGAMFEVPSACFDARNIFGLVDFGSIGSNDLIQYLFAIDRNNERVSADYDPEHPVLWKMIADLAAVASAAEKPLSICGEMAGRDGMPTRLVGSGVKSLSVSPRLIGKVRRELNRCTTASGEWR
jgi:phosphotransferase system enzyme I (PtsI)